MLIVSWRYFLCLWILKQKSVLVFFQTCKSEMCRIFEKEFEKFGRINFELQHFGKVPVNILWIRSDSYLILRLRQNWNSLRTFSKIERKERGKEIDDCTLWSWTSPTFSSIKLWKEISLFVVFSSKFWGNDFVLWTPILAKPSFNWEYMALEQQMKTSCWFSHSMTFSSFIFLEVPSNSWSLLIRLRGSLN